jgi:hypothetical protein
MASHRRKQQSDQSAGAEGGGEQAVDRERMVSRSDDDMR